MSRPLQIQPLTASQQELASDPRSLALADYLVARFLKRYPQGRHWARSAALMGLCQAAATFDPERGISFTTWATWRIKGQIQDDARTDQLCGYRRKFRGAGASAEPPRVYWVDRIGLSVQDAPPDDSADCIDALTRTLPPRQREVVRLYFTRCDCFVMKSLGKRIGLSEARVSQILKAALTTLRERAGVSGRQRANSGRHL